MHQFTAIQPVGWCKLHYITIIFLFFADMNIGITLMIVGMVTVFAVLVIIIQLSNLLIKIVNKVAPEEDVKPAKTAARVMPIAPDVVEAINQAVAKITGGKGTVAEIKSL